MSLLTVDTARTLIATDLSDPNLADLIDREEAELIARYGAHYAAATTIMAALTGGHCDLFLPRRIGSVSSINEAATLGGTATALAATAYYVWGSEGRITRLPEGTRWGRSVSVVYIPMDDRPLRTQVLIEIIRLALSQTAMQSEDRTRNGMKYAYQAPNWEQLRKRLYKRLAFPEI